MRRRKKYSLTDLLIDVSYAEWLEALGTSTTASRVAWAGLVRKRRKVQRTAWSYTHRATNESNVTVLPPI